MTSSETDEQVDRYQELLGQRRNFILHDSVAVLSFLVFGLVPPIVYGFSFYESDIRHLKEAAVAAASLICITVLAIAKAYTQVERVFTNRSAVCCTWGRGLWYFLFGRLPD